MEPLIEVHAECDEYVLFAIQYLDPDFKRPPRPVHYRANAEGLVTLLVLLGGLFISLGTILFRVR